jgi:hypothetical protein
MAQRWQALERVPVEWYRDRYPEIDGEALVTLIYEEYCLREKAGEAPGAAAYVGRFSDVAASFRAVFEIHDLIRQDRAPGTGTSAGRRSTTSLTSRLPEVGEPIAGFHLVGAG